MPRGTDHKTRTHELELDGKCLNLTVDYEIHWESSPMTRDYPGHHEVELAGRVKKAVEITETSEVVLDPALIQPVFDKWLAAHEEEILDEF